MNNNFQIEQQNGGQIAVKHESAVFRVMLFSIDPDNNSSGLSLKNGREELIKNLNAARDNCAFFRTPYLSAFEEAGSVWKIDRRPDDGFEVYDQLIQDPPKSVPDDCYAIESTPFKVFIKKNNGTTSTVGTGGKDTPRLATLSIRSRTMVPKNVGHITQEIRCEVVCYGSKCGKEDRTPLPDEVCEVLYQALFGPLALAGSKQLVKMFARLGTAPSSEKNSKITPKEVVEHLIDISAIGLGEQESEHFRNFIFKPIVRRTATVPMLLRELDNSNTANTFNSFLSKLTENSNFPDNPKTKKNRQPYRLTSEGWEEFLKRSKDNSKKVYGNWLKKADNSESLLGRYLRSYSSFQGMGLQLSASEIYQLESMWGVTHLTTDEVEKSGTMPLQLQGVSKTRCIGVIIKPRGRTLLDSIAKVTQHNRRDQEYNAGLIGSMMFAENIRQEFVGP